MYSTVAAVQKRIPFFLWSTLHCEKKWNGKWSVSRPLLKETAFENALYVDLSSYKDDTEKIEAATCFMESCGACRGDQVNRNTIELGFASADKMAAAIERGFVYKNKPAAFGRTFSGANVWIASVSGVDGTVVEMTRALKGVFNEIGEIADICLRTLTKANLLGRAADVYVKLAAEKPLPSLVKIGDKYANVSWRKFVLTCGYCRQSSHTTSECETLAQKKGWQVVSKRRRKSKVAKAQTASAKPKPGATASEAKPASQSLVTSKWALKGAQPVVPERPAEPAKAELEKKKKKKRKKKVPVVEPTAAPSESENEMSAAEAEAVPEEDKSAAVAAADLEMEDAEEEAALTADKAAAEKAAAVVMEVEPAAEARKVVSEDAEAATDVVPGTGVAEAEVAVATDAQASAATGVELPVGNVPGPTRPTYAELVAGKQPALRPSREAKTKARQTITQLCVGSLGAKKEGRISKKAPIKLRTIVTRRAEAPAVSKLAQLKQN